MTRRRAGSRSMKGKAATDHRKGRASRPEGSSFPRASGSRNRAADRSSARAAGAMGPGTRAGAILKSEARIRLERRNKDDVEKCLGLQSIGFQQLAFSCQENERWPKMTGSTLPTCPKALRGRQRRLLLRRGRFVRADAMDRSTKIIPIAKRAIVRVATGG